MGRVVLTTDTPGCRETVTDGANGWLVPAHDPQALAQRMRHLIENPAILAAMGEESRRIAMRDFDVRRQNARLLETMQVSGVQSGTQLGQSRELRKPRASALGWPDVAAGSGLPLYPKPGKVR